MPSTRCVAYKDDLAWIHNAGYGQFAASAARELLRQLRKAGIRSGTIVDLGCGGGILVEAMMKAGYDAVGIDQSPDMIAFARLRVPSGEFRQESFLDSQLPSCIAVTAIGEVLNYLFDRRNTLARLRTLFRRIHKSLKPGGLFLFDVAVPGRIPEGRRCHYRAHNNWICLSLSEEDRKRRLLTRTITSFRRVGNLYRRDDEVHRLRLYTPRELIDGLRQAGFRVRVIRRYPDLEFPPGYVGFIARRP